MKRLPAISIPLFVLMLCFGEVAAQPVAPGNYSSGNYNSGQGSSQGQATPTDSRSRAKIHTELGAMYFQAGNMAVALDELRVAQELDSDYAPAYSVRGLVHASLREFDLAEAQFNKALRLTPNDPEVNNNYGWFLCQTGKERQSIAYFLNALKSPLYATPDLAYANAGACALKAGDLEGAEAYLQQAVRMARDGAIVPRTQLATLHYKRGNYQEARILINAVLKDMDLPSAEVLWLALRVEKKLGNRSAESSLAVQLRGRHPNSRENQEFIKGNFE